MDKKLQLKNTIRGWVQGFLKFCAKRKLAKIRPHIIGITGSVGKTSTKDAIYAVLKNKFDVKKSDKNFNTEFGLPLAILNQQSGFSSPLAWISILIKSFLSAFSKEKYQMLVLEMGVDKPGDMDDILSIVKPHIAVITRINIIHTNPGQFQDTKAILNEKKKIALGSQKDCIAVLNYDDELLREFGKNEYKGQILWFGTTPVADLYVNYVDQTKAGLHGDIVFRGKHARFAFPILGRHHMTVLMPAIACGLLHDMTLEECVDALSKFSLPPGRMNLIQGINNSEIIDSSYNASPAATMEALKVLSEIGQNRRKIAVLGNMNELGEYTEREHRRIGQIVEKYADILITVGDSAQMIAEEAGLNGISTENIMTFSDPLAAGEFLKNYLKTNDIVLFKGSQNNVRLEKAVKMVMENPSQAETLLVRQGAGWE